MSDDESSFSPALDPAESASNTDDDHSRGARRVASVMAVILAGATMLLLARPAWVEMWAAVPRTVVERIPPLLVQAAASAAEEFGDADAKVSSTSYEVRVDKGGFIVALGGETLSAVILRAPLFASVVLVIALAAWRTGGLGRKSGSVLALLTLLLVCPLLIVLDAVFQGAAAGLASPSRVDFAWGTAKAMAPGLTCAILAGVWWVVAWAVEEDGPRMTGPADLVCVRPPSLWAAAIAVALTAIFWALAALAGLSGGDGWMSARFSVGATLAGCAAVLLVWSLLRRSRGARWAIVPMLLIVPLGSEMAGAAALLLVIVAARDERLAAWTRQPMTEAAWGRIGVRMARPLRPWIWLLVAVAAVGAALRLDPFGRGHHPGLFGDYFLFGLRGEHPPGSVQRSAKHHRAAGKRSSPPTAIAAPLQGPQFPLGQRQCDDRRHHKHHRISQHRSVLVRPRPRIPRVVGSWTGVEVGQPATVVPVNRPQAIVYRQYTGRNSGAKAELLVACLEDPRDAIAFDPALLFSSGGWTVSRQQEATWHIGVREARGMEYEFASGQDSRRRVYVARLIAASNGTFVADLKDVAILATQKGLTHVQVTMDGSASKEQREATVAELMGACMPVIEARWGGGH